jgi:hypothetical protein
MYFWEYVLETLLQKYISGFILCGLSNEVVAAIAYAYAFDMLHRVESAIARYFSLSQEGSLTPLELGGQPDLLLLHTSVHPEI